MTVKELIEKLSILNQEATVVVNAQAEGVIVDSLVTDVRDISHETELSTVMIFAERD